MSDGVGKIGVRATDELVLDDMLEAVLGPDRSLVPEADSTTSLISWKVAEPSNRRGVRHFHIVYQGIRVFEKTHDKEKALLALRYLCHQGLAAQKQGVHFHGAVAKRPDGRTVAFLGAEALRERLLPDLREQGWRFLALERVFFDEQMRVQPSECPWMIFKGGRRPTKRYLSAEEMGFERFQRASSLDEVLVLNSSNLNYSRELGSLDVRERMMVLLPTAEIRQVETLVDAVERMPEMVEFGYTCPDEGYSLVMDYLLRRKTHPVQPEPEPTSTIADRPWAPLLGCYQPLEVSRNELQFWWIQSGLPQGGDPTNLLELTRTLVAQVNYANSLRTQIEKVLVTVSDRRSAVRYLRSLIEVVRNSCLDPANRNALVWGVEWNSTEETIENYPLPGGEEVISMTAALEQSLAAIVPTECVSELSRVVLNCFYLSHLIAQMQSSSAEERASILHQFFQITRTLATATQVTLDRWPLAEGNDSA
jgi:hypothetical protein